MRLLLDTSTFIWAMSGDARLSSDARRAIESSANEIFLSLVSVWELAIKISRGKLVLSKPLVNLIPNELGVLGVKLLPIELEHVIAVSSLPDKHRDPFDRLLACQSKIAEMAIVSGDEIFDSYGLSRIW